MRRRTTYEYKGTRQYGTTPADLARQRANYDLWREHRDEAEVIPTVRSKRKTNGQTSQQAYDNWRWEVLAVLRERHDEEYNELLHMRRAEVGLHPIPNRHETIREMRRRAGLEM